MMHCKTNREIEKEMERERGMIEIILVSFDSLAARVELIFLLARVYVAEIIDAVDEDQALAKTKRLKETLFQCDTDELRPVIEHIE